LKRVSMSGTELRESQRTPIIYIHSHSNLVISNKRGGWALEEKRLAQGHVTVTSRVKTCLQVSDCWVGALSAHMPLSTVHAILNHPFISPLICCWCRLGIVPHRPVWT
jgi:hypothetical protein